MSGVPPDPGQLPGRVAASWRELPARHRREILRCVYNSEKATLAEHPLGRIFRSEEIQGELVLYSTTQHLVSRIGKELRDAFGGEFQLKYGPELEWAIARWHRDG
jgi:hypothetical protein